MIIDDIRINQNYGKKEAEIITEEEIIFPKGCLKYDDHYLNFDAGTFAFSPLRMIVELVGWLEEAKKNNRHPRTYDKEHIDREKFIKKCIKELEKLL